MKTLDSQLLDEIVARITGAVHPLRIILFGSASRGEMNSDSDIDLLVIMPNGTHRRKTSRKIFQELRGLGVSKDVVVVTESDVAEHADNPSLILKPALKEGRELYAAG
jgi:predicted nucleotidyltransferase